MKQHDTSMVDEMNCKYQKLGYLDTNFIRKYRKVQVSDDSSFSRHRYFASFHMIFEISNVG